MASMDFLVVLVVLTLAHCATVMGIHPDVQHQISALEERVAALEAEEHEDHNEHHAVLFSVFRSAADNVVQNEPIIFNEVMLNGEEGYNATTGIFTCPQDGIYSLSYSAFLAGGAVVQVALVKAGTVWCALQGNLTDGSFMLSERTTLLRLVKGEQVWVELQQGTLHRAQGPARMSFQGYRISE